MTKKKSKKIENYHFANSKNSIIKSILSTISSEIHVFHQNDKSFVKKFFNNECAYSGAKLTNRNIEFDHLIPANLKNGGLTLLGNMVPTTKSLNKIKSGKTYIDFLKAQNLENIERQEKLKNYQELFHYPTAYYSASVEEKLNSLVEKYEELFEIFVKEIIIDLEKDDIFQNVSKLNFDEKVEVYKVIKNSQNWRNNQGGSPYKIIKLFLEIEKKEKGVNYSNFKILLKENNIDNLNNLIKISKKNYGKVFEIKDNFVTLWKPVKKHIENQFNFSQLSDD